MTGPESHPLILLVDDSDAVRDAFSILLSESGYRTLQAASGGDALRLAEERRPDLILLDFGLPDIDGLDVVRQLKADPETRGIRVVALTGRDQDEGLARAAGCEAFLVKPVQTRTLLALIGATLA